VKVFGEWADSPHDQRVPTPVGALCCWCDEPIAESDAGCLLLALFEEGEVAEHRECFLRGVLGSVGHQFRLCSCFGGTIEDPPLMTRRGAARAAVAVARQIAEEGWTP
jgi:hypothetical protein